MKNEKFWGEVMRLERPVSVKDLFDVDLEELKVFINDLVAGRQRSTSATKKEINQRIVEQGKCDLCESLKPILWLDGEASLYTLCKLCQECIKNIFGAFDDSSENSLPPTNQHVVYALFNPKGKLCKCSDNIDDVTNHLPKKTYTTEMWNSLFGSTTKKRIKVYTDNGWEVCIGRFERE